MDQVQLPLLNNGLMHILAVDSRSISPSSHRTLIQPKSMDNRLNRTTIGQERHHDHNQIYRFAQPLKHGSPTGAEGPFAYFTAIALPLAIMDDNVALVLLASCGTRHIRAKWFRRVPRLCICLHKLQYANGRLFLQAPFSFHRLVESYRARKLAIKILAFSL